MKTHNIISKPTNIIESIHKELSYFEMNKKYSFNNNNINTNTEQYICEILKMQYDKSYSFVEFYFTNINTNTNVDFELYKYENREKIEKTYEIPAYSQILFLDNNSDHLFLISNITNEKYKYKQFENETDLYIFYPKKGYQIEFDGNKCYGKINMNHSNYTPSYILIINVYDTISNNIYCKNILPVRQTIKEIDKIDLQINVEENDKVEKDSIFTELFFENLLYKKNISKELLKDFSEIKTQTHISKKKNDLIIKNTNYKEELHTINTTTEYNRFFQRFIYHQLYSPHICEFILTNYKLHKTDICPIEKLTNLVQYILYSFEKIHKFFINSYGLTSDINIKFSTICPSNMIPTIDQFCCMIFLERDSIIIFEDKTKYTVKIGDLIMFNNKIKYSIENENIVLLLNIELL
jgi:hypothetical protein